MKQMEALLKQNKKGDFNETLELAKQLKSELFKNSSKSTKYHTQKIKGKFVDYRNTYSRFKSCCIILGLEVIEQPISKEKDSKIDCFLILPSEKIPFYPEMEYKPRYFLYLFMPFLIYHCDAIIYQTKKNVDRYDYSMIDESQAQEILSNKKYLGAKIKNGNLKELLFKKFLEYLQSKNHIEYLESEYFKREFKNVMKELENE